MASFVLFATAGYLGLCACSGIIILAMLYHDRRWYRPAAGPDSGSTACAADAMDAPAARSLDSLRDALA